jgi:hypothetical protein
MFRNKSGGMIMIRLFLGLLIWGVIGNIPVASAIAIKKTAKPVASLLVPHRAIYEITLANRKEAISVSDVQGRMVFEVTGSPCDGYTQNMRMVTRITDERGKQTLSDIRSSTWEEGKGRRFRFSSSQYFDRALQEVVSGSATRNRKERDITVKVEKPSEVTLGLSGDVLFPTQHSLAILRAAKAGKKRLDVRIYDGSEQGQGFYQTYSFIGNRDLPDKRSAGKKTLKKNARRELSKDDMKLARLGLAKLPSWPVAISYFNGQGNSDDSLPAYELSFRLYPNGVSRNLLINYGEFAVHGSLDRIKYLRRTTCSHKKNKY